MLVWWLVEEAWNIDSGTGFCKRCPSLRKSESGMEVSGLWLPDFMLLRKKKDFRKYNKYNHSLLYLEGKKDIKRDDILEYIPLLYFYVQ